MNRWKFHAALATPALLFFAPQLFFGRALFVRDTAMYFYPHRQLVVDALHALRLPQWTSSEYAGVALLADLNNYVFHPLSWLTAIFPMPWSYQLFVFAAALFGAYGAARTARELGLSDEAQLVAGLAYAWSGPFVSLIESGQFLVLAFIPWLCAAAPRKSVPAIAVAAALVFTAGTPELGACGFLFALLLAGRDGFLRFAAGCALGAACAAVQLVPTALFLSQSSRAHGFGAAQVVNGSLSLWRLPSVVIPFFAGALDAEGTRFWALGAEHMVWVEELYLGAVVIALAVLGWRRVPRLLLAAGVLFLLALGGETPPTRWLWVHVLNSIRFPEKLYAAAALPVALAAGAGWERLGVARARGWLIAAGVCALAAVAGPFIRLSLSGRELQCFVDSAMWTIPVEMALAAATCVLIARGAPRKYVALLFVLDLAPPALRMDWTIPASELSPPVPVVQRILQDPGNDPHLYRLDVESTGITPADSELLGDPSWSRPRRLYWLRHRAVVHPGEAQGQLLLMRGYSGLPPGGVKQLFSSGGLDALSVRYAIEFGHPGPSIHRQLGFQPMASLDDGWLRLLRNPKALPRVRVEPSGSAQLVRDDPERVELAASGPGRAVLADTLSAGWRVTVDGAAATPLPAQGLREVEIGPGTHHVIWTYRAPGLAAGGLLSILGVIACAYLAARRRVGGP